MTNEQLRIILESIKREQEQSRQRRSGPTYSAFGQTTVTEPAVEPGIEHAKQLVPCDRCGVLTANPKQLWRADRESEDVCKPCANKTTV